MEIRSNLLAVYPAVVMIKKEPDSRVETNNPVDHQKMAKINQEVASNYMDCEIVPNQQDQDQEDETSLYAQEKNSHNHGQQDEAPEVLVLRGKASNQARRSKGTNQRLALPKMIRMADSMTEKMAKTPLLPLVTASWSSEVDGYLTEINRVGCLRFVKELINQNPSQHPPPPLKLKISRFISQRGREAEAGF
ncbi:hypothetical protein BY996DRAFT_6537121 [Phakopsora pachyrhizi]|nr:hypothetical protein BY996DRAFT_6537121 [Phakopsora pachyrhizi]